MIAVVLTGMVPWKQLGTADPLAFARIGKGLTDFDYTDIMVI